MVVHWLDNCVVVCSNLGYRDMLLLSFIIFFCYIGENLETLATVKEAREVRVEQFT